MWRWGQAWLRIRFYIGLVHSHPRITTGWRVALHNLTRGLIGRVISVRIRHPPRHAGPLLSDTPAIGAVIAR